METNEEFNSEVRKALNLPEGASNAEVFVAIGKLLANEPEPESYGTLTY